MKSEKLKKDSGITLISLVITIIVLLILTGITLTTTLSDTGIAEKTENAVNQTKIEEEKEIINLAILKVIKIKGELTVSSENSENDLKDALKNALNYYLNVKDKDEINVSYADGSFTVILPSGREYTIDQYNTITYNES